MEYVNHTYSLHTRCFLYHISKFVFLSTLIFPWIHIWPFYVSRNMLFYIHTTSHISLFTGNTFTVFHFYKISWEIFPQESYEKMFFTFFLTFYLRKQFLFILFLNFSRILFNCPQAFHSKSQCIILSFYSFLFNFLFLFFLFL